MPMCKYTTYSSARCIPFNSQWFDKIWQGKNRMAAYCSAQGVHSRLLSINLMPSNLFAKKSIKRGSYVYKIVHKATIVVAEIKEHLQFFDIGRRSPLLNCLSFLTVGLIII